MTRPYNFSAGPAAIPDAVLIQAASEMLDWHGSGMGVMEMSHRGKEYDAVHCEAVANITKLMNLPSEYGVLFMTGGATSQFSIVPMNLLPESACADYTNTGAWGSKATKEAKQFGQINVIANTEKDFPVRLPEVPEPEDKDTFTFMYAGSHGVTNALDVMVDAAALLQARRPQVGRRRDAGLPAE